MMRQPDYKVFISSTNRDLFTHRQAVRDMIMRLKQLTPVGMEDFGAQDGDATEVSLKETTACDIFVGIYAYRYGYRPDGGTGITEQEYHEAQRRDLPRLVFVVDENQQRYKGWANLNTHRDDRDDDGNETEAGQLLAAFKANLGETRVWDTFTTPDDLAAKVATALANWRDEIAPLLGWIAPIAPLIPDERRFVGREREIADVTAMLQRDQTVAITAAVAGAGGIGKTYLAQHLAHILRDDFPGGVFFASLGPDAKDTDTLLQRVLPGWAQAHPQGRAVENPADLTPEIVTKLLADPLRPGRILAILDDVWHAGPARALKAVLPGDSVCLVTTRNRAVALTPRIFDLDRLSEADALKLLRDRTNHGNDLGALEPHARDLIGLLGGHALALEIAAAKIAINGADYLEHYTGYVRDAMAGDNPLGELTLEDAHTAREKSVEVTLALSYDPLSDAQKQRFRALGIFPPETDYSARSVFAVWGADTGDPDAERAARDALLELFRLGLVQKEPGATRYHQHALLRAYAGALAQQHNEAGANLWRYIGHVIGDITRQFETLWMKKELWNDVILVDREHIHIVGDLLAAWVDEMLGAETLDALAQPEPPDELPEHIDRESDVLAAGRDFAAAVYWYIFHRRVAQGRRWLRMGLACARVTGDKNREGLMTSGLASWHQNRGEMAQVLAYHQASLAICRDQNDRHNEAATLNNIGMVYRATGQPQQALDYYQQALPITREVGDRAGEATTLNNIGMVYQATGQPQQALAHFQQALPIMREVGDRAGEATTLNNIGEVYRATGQPQQALDHFQQALPIRREVGDRAGEAATLNNIGGVYHATGQPQQALEYYQQALPLRREVGDRAGEATTLNNIGGVYHDLGQPQQALEHYQQALPIMREVGDRAGEATTLNNMAAIYWQQEEPERAADTFRQIVQIDREIGDVASEALHLFNLATVLQSLNQTGEAIQLVERSIAILEQYNLPQCAGGGTIAQRRAFLAQLRGEAPPVPPVMGAIQAYFDAQSLEDKQAVLTQHADLLLTDDAERIFTQNIQQAGENPQFRQALEQHRDLLRACREHGIAEVFRQLQAVDADESGGAESQVPPVVGAIQAFLQTPDWDAAKTVIEQHADLLLSDEADTAFTQIIDNAPDDVPEAAVENLKRHLAVLRLCREHGIDEAFRRIQAGDADESGGDDSPDAPALPDDFEDRVVAGLAGTPQDKMALFNYLDSLPPAALVDVVKQAVFMTDFAGLGADLTGEQAAAWGRILARLESGGADES